MARFFQSVWSELRSFFDGLKAGPVIVFLLSGVVLWAYDYYGDTKFFRRHLRALLGLTGIEAEAAGYFYWYGMCFVLLMLIPILAIALNPEEQLKDYGLGLGNWKLGGTISLIFYAIMFVALLFFYKIPMVQKYYPLFDRSTESWQLFLFYELAYALYFVAWEFMFRGYMLFGLEKHIGKWAIFVQMLPFAILHFGKPDLEALSSVFGGVILGWLAWRTRSFWYGVFMHAAMAVTLDLLVGIPRIPG